MSRNACANCGQSMGLLREQHQQANARRVWMRWLICSNCHHVALDDWSFIDTEPAPLPTGSASEHFFNPERGED